MPVSLERLIAEVEPNVITEDLTRQCIQVEGTDQEAVEEKMRTMHLRQVETVAYSFKSLAKIDNLKPLSNLVKLQLDNNNIQKIENLQHLTNLTWLDLSFNKITKIEGLDQLTKLVDLSLFNNQVSELENLDALVNLNVFSIGNNNLKKLDCVMYLRKFSNLRLINLAGNPLCKEPDYQSYVLSHIKDLTYLDYRRVAPADVQTAMEQHQDEMIEITEREEQQAEEDKVAAERAKVAALMLEANLVGVDSLSDDMLAEDPEWSRLAQVPGLVEAWGDLRDKMNLATEEFKTIILEAHTAKKEEYGAWQAAVKGALAEKDGAARAMLVDYEKAKKAVVRYLIDHPLEADEKVLGPKVKLMALKQHLLQLEVEASEAVAELCAEFDSSYSEIADTNKSHYNAFFTTVRELENTFFNVLSTTGLALFERYNQETTDWDSIPEEARILMQDKETLVNSIQASHDAHTSKIDSLEDQLISREARSTAELMTTNNLWQSRRNRDRIAEIINYVERNMMELDEMVGEEDAGE